MYQQAHNLELAFLWFTSAKLSAYDKQYTCAPLSQAHIFLTVYNIVHNIPQKNTIYRAT